jgi:hypothetical protein
MAPKQYEEQRLLRTGSAKQGGLVRSMVTLIEVLAKEASAVEYDATWGDARIGKEVASFDGMIGGNLLLKFTRSLFKEKIR